MHSHRKTPGNGTTASAPERGFKALEPQNPATQMEVETFAAYMKALGKRQGISPGDISAAIRRQRSVFSSRGGFDSDTTMRLFETVAAKYTPTVQEGAAETPAARPAAAYEAPDSNWRGNLLHLAACLAIAGILAAGGVLTLRRVDADHKKQMAKHAAHIERVSNVYASHMSPERIPIIRAAKPEEMPVITNIDAPAKPEREERQVFILDAYHQGK